MDTNQIDDSESVLESDSSLSAKKSIQVDEDECSVENNPDDYPVLLTTGKISKELIQTYGLEISPDMVRRHMNDFEDFLHITKSKKGFRYMDSSDLELLYMIIVERKHSSVDEVRKKLITKQFQDDAKDLFDSRVFTDKLIEQTAKQISSQLEASIEKSMNQALIEIQNSSKLISSSEEHNADKEVSTFMQQIVQTNELLLKKLEQQEEKIEQLTQIQNTQKEKKKGLFGFIKK